MLRLRGPQCSCHSRCCRLHLALVMAADVRDGGFAKSTCCPAIAASTRWLQRAPSSPRGSLADAGVHVADPQKACLRRQACIAQAAASCCGACGLILSTRQQRLRQKEMVKNRRSSAYCRLEQIRNELYRRFDKRACSCVIVRTNVCVLYQLSGLSTSSHSRACASTDHRTST